ncbi:hypothetical protein PRMUPPPA20_06510 [Xylanibacter ruminicola]|uniref:Uncharacterized protein n=3 Tax=Bacteroidales TaxID=171549 RepID=D5EVJ8_XYLR2|nr:hypothetical protein PRU_0132 [Xylanibacter ruminicola 23]GJG32542.1 hypothetical protein PRMUPPPA20_06510 [Xylanibacter ruminicola]SEA87092.1 hypothetical protein SAMN05216462_2883 [Xylanibacter ruminicola]
MRNFASDFSVKTNNRLFMKRNTILAVVAGIMLAIGFGPYLLLLLVIAPFAYFIIKRKERTAVPRVTYATVEEAKQRYGEPDGVVVLDASRANELPALILFYPNHDIAIIAGEELKLSSLECVMSKNMATPYTIDEYAVIIGTNDPLRPTIELRVGYGAVLAGDIAAQIDAYIQ